MTVPQGTLPRIDVDLNGQGDTLTDGAVGPSAQRTDSAAIQNYLDSLGSALDVDLSQNADALSDGIMIIRSLFGFTGTALTDGAVDPFGQRTDPAAVAIYLDNLNPQRELISPLVTGGPATRHGPQRDRRHYE